MQNIRISELAQALYTVNRHAKTALQPQHLYWIKKQTINKLLQEKHAKKIGLHFSDNPKFSNQHSTLLVKVSDYYFHIPPSKGDFQKLEHLGNLDENFRNPPSKMSLSQAKRIVYQYIDWHPEKEERQKQIRKPSYFTPSSLGKMEWPPHRKRYPNQKRTPKKPK
ncbi:YkyB family protein [Virgibacillus halophilus]|uniref:YkyB family protein n=1 Tax=Tigheibacillus halophilus TaxID=361280 RepID=UPI003625C104